MTVEERITAAQAALIDGNGGVAESLFQEILYQEPENVFALDGMGVICCQKGEPGYGINYFEEALRHWAFTELDSPEKRTVQATLLFHHAFALRADKQHREAVQAYLKCLALTPDDPGIVLSFAQLLYDLEQYEQSAVYFKKLTELQPNDPSAWLTLGYVYARQEKMEKSIAPLQRAVELDPSSPESCFFLAESLRKTERFDESLSYYQQMLQVAMEWPQAIHGYGKSLLSLGNLADGWDAMEFRLACNFGSWQRHWLTNWDGTENEDKTVLAYSEEGIAADLMFASCLPDFINSVGRAVVECDTSLHGLFRRSFPRATLVPLATSNIGNESMGMVNESGGETVNPWGERIDSQIAFGSLPRYFRREKLDYPLRRVYLVPDPVRVEKWSNKLAELGSTPKIGVLWSGSWTAETPQQASVPTNELRNLMQKNVGDVAWVCLQHGSKQKEVEQIRLRTPIQIQLYHEAFQYDMDEIAALIASLDLVLTPPGYIAHLAGALGVQTWLMLPAKADWRHCLDSSRSLWHPSMQIYRQKRGEGWREMFQQIDAELKKYLASYQPSKENMFENFATIPFPNTVEQNRGRKVA